MSYINMKLNDKETTLKVMEYLRNDKTLKSIQSEGSFIYYFLGEEGVLRIKRKDKSLEGLTIDNNLIEGIKNILNKN